MLCWFEVVMMKNYVGMFCVEVWMLNVRYRGRCDIIGMKIRYSVVWLLYFWFGWVFGVYIDVECSECWFGVVGLKVYFGGWSYF